MPKILSERNTMFQEKIKHLTKKTQQDTLKTLKLLQQFKWYMLIYLLFYCGLIMEYLNPPEINSPIWKSEAIENSWNYTNQEVYIGSMKMTLVEFLLLFLIGTSNMRNHPKLAKFIFAFPLLSAICYLVIEFGRWLLSLIV